MRKSDNWAKENATREDAWSVEQIEREGRRRKGIRRAVWKWKSHERLQLQTEMFNDFVPLNWRSSICSSSSVAPVGCVLGFVFVLVHTQLTYEQCIVQWGLHTKLTDYNAMHFVPQCWEQGIRWLTCLKLNVHMSKGEETRVRPVSKSTWLNQVGIEGRCADSNHGDDREK